MKFPILSHRNVLAAALLLVSPALLQAQKKPAATESPKLDIRLVVTEEAGKVFQPVREQSGQLPQLQSAKVVAKGKLVAAVVYLKDCKPNAAGKCNVELDFWGVGPGGKTFQDRKGIALWRDKAPPPPGFVQPGSSYMKMQFEPADPPGTYLVVAVAHDRISGVDSRAEVAFELK